MPDTLMAAPIVGQEPEPEQPLIREVERIALLCRQQPRPDPADLLAAIVEKTQGLVAARYEPFVAAVLRSERCGVYHAMRALYGGEATEAAISLGAALERTYLREVQES